MNAAKIISDDMTLEEKLRAIDLALKEQQDVANERAARLGIAAAPVDPADLTMCEGCQ